MQSKTRYNFQILNLVHHGKNFEALFFKKNQYLQLLSSGYIHSLHLKTSELNKKIENFQKNTTVSYSRDLPMKGQGSCVWLTRPVDQLSCTMATADGDCILEVSKRMLCNAAACRGSYPEVYIHSLAKKCL